MAKLIAGVPAAAAMVLLAAGCGSSAHRSAAAPSTAKVSATRYVTALCEAVAPFEKDVATRSSALDKTATRTLAADKADLVSYLGALSNDSATALTKLKAAGVPEVTGGATFATTIITTFTRVNTALSRSQTLADSLSTSNRTTFQSGADSLASAVKESLGQLGAGFKKTASNTALNAAAAKVTACHTL